MPEPTTNESEQVSLEQGRFESAKKAFRDRLQRVRDEGADKQRNRRSLAQQAGVPSEYLNDIWVSEKPDATVHIYFGSRGPPTVQGTATTSWIRAVIGLSQ
jgi:hypothetical protein